MCFEIRNKYDLKYLLKYGISSCKFVVNGWKYLDGWFVSYSVFYSKIVFYGVLKCVSFGLIYFIF